MAALTEDRQTRLLSVGREWRTFPVAASATIFAGAMVALNASGYLVPATTSSTLLCVGIAQAPADNGSGANGDLECEVDTGIGRYNNSSAADEITIAEVGDDCYAVDDQTVAKTDDGGTRSKAGKVHLVDSTGVYVDFRK